MPKIFRLGSRRSPLAIFQSKEIAEKLSAFDPSIKIEYVFLDSEGDRLKDYPLRDLGGKNVFIKDIEQALLDGVIDIAVHSFKDISANLDEKTSLAGFLPSDYLQDCIVGFVPFDEMESIATSSLRRSWFLKQPTFCACPRRDQPRKQRLFPWANNLPSGLIDMRLPIY